MNKENDRPPFCYNCWFYIIRTEKDRHEICDKGVDVTANHYKSCDLFSQAYKTIGRLATNLSLDRKIFETLAKNKIFEFIYGCYGASECEEIVDDDVEMIWFSSVLGNMKALFKVPVLPFYVEVTYKENSKEIILDFYESIVVKTIKSNEVLNAIRHNKD